MNFVIIVSADVLASNSWNTFSWHLIFADAKTYLILWFSLFSTLDNGSASTIRRRHLLSKQMVTDLPLRTHQPRIYNLTKTPTASLDTGAGNVERGFMGLTPGKGGVPYSTHARVPTVAHDLATQGTSALAAMGLALLSRNIPVIAQKG